MDVEDKVKFVFKDVKVDGVDFVKIVKEKIIVIDKKVEYKFDFVGIIFFKEVMLVVFKLDKNGVLDVVLMVDLIIYKISYYIIKVIDKIEKKFDWKFYKNCLKEVIFKDKISDRVF